MRLGLVYDLRDDYLAQGCTLEQVAELDTLETIQMLDEALTRLGHQVDRVGHGRALAVRLVAGERWDAVFSIAEGLRGRSREAQVPALLELFDQPYFFSDPLTMATTLDKAVAKRLVRAAGIPTAPFAVVGGPFQGTDPMPGEEEGALVPPLFIKPAWEGTGKGCDRASRVESLDQLRPRAEALARTFDQPVLVESYLPGREFTVGVVGNGPGARVVGIMEVLLHGQASQDGVYSFSNKEHFETRVRYHKVEDDTAVTTCRLALQAYHVLECRDMARLDFRCDAEGTPCFLEVNPLPGMNSIHSDLPILAGLAGLSYDTLLREIVEAGWARLQSRQGVLQGQSSGTVA
ncbi:MAG: D-alanine--D-alanine ligase [Magnetococcales bacterium]|nr:D-alanine--D-alanine ligase [Magnetococcales bacterium]